MKLRDLPYTTDDIFPSGDFAFHMRFRRGNIGEFFCNTANDSDIIDERRKWLGVDARDYTAILSEGEAILNEVVDLAESLNIPTSRQSTPLETCIALGRVWEPDLLFLSSEENAQPILVGGCVCFPSSWSLQEKISLPLDMIHAPVPTFNAQFSNPVKQFLARIKPGISWERINWGLSRTSELNQHPNRQLPRLDATVSLNNVWFRAEYQSLVALPRSNGILFGIRLAIEPLEQLRLDPAFSAGLARALETMPDSVANYKGLLAARERLVDLLRAN